MTTPLPHEDGGEAWDQLALGGVTFTGKVAIGGDAVKKKLDKRRARGSDGGRTTDQGFDLREFRLTLTGWTDEHRDQLDAIVALQAIPAQGAARRNALAISHPSLGQAWPPVSQVLVESIGLLEMGEGVLFTQTLSVVEYLEPPARNVTHRPTPAAHAAETPIDPDVAQAFSSNPIPSPSTTSTGPVASGVP